MFTDTCRPSPSTLGDGPSSVRRAMYAVKQTLEKNMALLTEGGPLRLWFYKPSPPDGGRTPLRLEVKIVPGLRFAIRSL